MGHSFDSLICSGSDRSTDVYSYRVTLPTRGMPAEQKYEYQCVAIIGFGGKTTRTLNEYAQQGWELVEVVWIWHYLRRPVN